MNTKDFAIYKVKEISLETLLKSYNPKLINSYCKGCTKYNKVWSCPNFDFDELSLLKKYNYVYLIHCKINIDNVPYSHIEKEFKKIIKIVPEAENFKNPMGKIFNALYFSLRIDFDKVILDLEKQFKDSLSLISGRCLKCNPCEKELSKPCKHPETLRYSLESLGIDVMKVLKDNLDEDIQWSSNESSKYVTTVSALLSKEQLNSKAIETYLFNQ